MSGWFIIAIISPFLSSIIHHTDKFLLSKFVKKNSIGSIILFSSLFPIVVLPFFGFFGAHILSISGQQIFILICTGVLYALSLLFYFYALEDEETSMIVPMFQLIPIFGYFLGIVILNENIEIARVLSAIVVIIGATILSFEFEEETGLRFKLKPTMFMVAASLLLAMNDVIFKNTTIHDGSYVISMFWNLVGFVFFGSIMFICVKQFRSGFIDSIRENGKKFLALNILNESLQTVATITFSFAILLAPVALVMLVDAYQPVFVLIMGVLLTKYFPHITTEKISNKHLFHKILAITIIVIGSIFVYH
jgi:drug/metabolite transporter (DMT)-like permease